MNSPHILVVEDDGLLRDQLTDALKKEGFNVSSAPDAKTALHQALAEHPDLIVLDILLPGEDGLAMLEELRKDAWGKGAQVLIVSNIDEKEYVARADKLGNCDYLLKADWTLDDLIAKVRERLC